MKGPIAEVHRIGGLFIVAIMVVYLIFVISALIGVLGSRIGCLGKIVWVLVIFAIPFLGSLLWHLVGKNSGRFNRY